MHQMWSMRDEVPSKNPDSWRAWKSQTWIGQTKSNTRVITLHFMRTRGTWNFVICWGRFYETKINQKRCNSFASTLQEGVVSGVVQKLLHAHWTFPENLTVTSIGKDCSFVSDCFGAWNSKVAGLSRALTKRDCNLKLSLLLRSILEPYVSFAYNRLNAAASRLVLCGSRFSFCFTICDSVNLFPSGFSKYLSSDYMSDQEVGNGVLKGYYVSYFCSESSL